MAEQDSTGFRRWTKEEDDDLRQAVAEFQGRNWKAISGRVPNRDHQQCRQRWCQVLAPDIVKGPWSAEEDELLISLVKEQPNKQDIDWVSITEKIKGRNVRQVKDRWECHLDPSINKKPFTNDENALLENLFNLHGGNHWLQIAQSMPGRTKEMVKKQYRRLHPEYNASHRGRPATDKNAPKRTISQMFQEVTKKAPVVEDANFSHIDTIMKSFESLEISAKKKSKVDQFFDLLDFVEGTFDDIPDEDPLKENWLEALDYFVEAAHEAPDVNGLLSDIMSLSNMTVAEVDQLPPPPTMRVIKVSTDHDENIDDDDEEDLGDGPILFSM